ncbi:MAG: hypothetical protein LBL56_08395 [Treponema sp.]|nr:hypothetical protein [Treponema sp.]
MVKRFIISGALRLIFLLLLPLPLFAQGYFRGLTRLRVLETRHFEIIYPAESEETARRLVLFADGAYEEISARLGISVGRKIPVAITPHIDEFNSFMNSMPYPHILLLDTPMDSEWTTFEGSLEKLFIHELTHAVSLSTRGRVMDFFHRIFGGWVYPPAFNAPLFMTEGIAVSFESIEAYGRANDPLIRQKLRQESYEGTFLSPHQVSGVSDMRSAALGAWYDYGGLFSRYLQETYGMEKYAELWRVLGNGFHFSFLFYNNGFYYYFKKVYGVSVQDAWNGMRESLTLEGLEDSGGMILRRGLPFKRRNVPSRITGMAAAGERIFVLDRFTRRLFIYNGEKEKTERTIPMDVSAYDVTVSPGGDRFLVSSYRYHGSLAEAVVTEYSGENGRPGRIWRGLYRGSYFRDGVVGIGSEGRKSSIVFRAGNPSETNSLDGEAPEEVLLEGDGDLSFTNPRPLNGRWIAFTAARGGKRELGFYDYDTKEVYRAATGLPDDQARWEFIRYLQVSGGRLLFGYDHDDRMYKLGVIDIAGLETGSTLRAVFGERDFSGAVALPVLAGTAIYYSGSFSDSDRLMRYPERLEDLGGISTPLYLLPWEPAGGRSASKPGTEFSSESFLESFSEVFFEAPPVEAPRAVEGRQFPSGPAAGQSGEFAPPVAPAAPSAPVASATSVAPGGEPEPLPSRVYFPFKYLNPLYLWFPFPLVRDDPDTLLRLDGGGVYSIMIDPTESNIIVLRAAMDGRFMSANFNINWTNMNLGFPLAIEFSDDVTVDAIPYRALRFSAQSTFTRSLGSQGIRGFLGAGFSFSQFYIGTEKSAYTWDFHSNAYKFMAAMGMNSLTVQPWEDFGQGIMFRVIGWGLSVSGPYDPGKLYPRFDSYFQAAFEPFFPLRFTLYGAWDAYRDGMNLQGASSQYPSPVFQSVAFSEYQTRGLEWIAGGEVEMRLFSLDVQRGFSHIYINRFLGTLAYRAGLYDGGGLFSPDGNKLWNDLRLPQSLVLRLGAEISSAILTSSPIRVSAYFQTALKLSRFAQGPADFTDVIAISPQINISF